jgi:hypothetical protein
MHPNFRIIGIEDVGNAQAIISEVAQAGGGACVILPQVAKGSIFENAPQSVLVLDLRYEGGFHLLRGNHPRKEGLWTQYSHLTTGLARNIVVSDSINNDTKIETWESKNHQIQSAPYGLSLASEEYRHLHNHYQNFLSEVYNFSENLNGVAIWGDSGAFVPGAKSWGAFFSARSWPVRWQGYTPTGVEYEPEDFDAALVGVEIDVLNSGRDALDPSPKLGNSMAKVGVQIVGFGNKNTAAIEIRSEDSDDPKRDSSSRRGTWHWGIIIRNALHTNSTVLFSENGHIRRGIDLSHSICSEGALLIAGSGRSSGVRFDLGDGGEVYRTAEGTLVVEGGTEGVRIQTKDGNFLELGPTGQVSMSDSVRESFIVALGLRRS